MGMQGRLDRIDEEEVLCKRRMFVVSIPSRLQLVLRYGKAMPC